MSRDLVKNTFKGRAWIRSKSGVNSMLYGDESESWWISYNPSSVNTFGAGSSMLSDSPSDDETAIVTDGKYYILKGDWRKQYEGIIDDGQEACLKFYAAHPKYHSSWSNELPEQIPAQTKSKSNRRD